MSRRGACARYRPFPRADHCMTCGVSGATHRRRVKRQREQRRAREIEQRAREWWGADVLQQNPALRRRLAAMLIVYLEAVG